MCHNSRIKVRSPLQRINQPQPQNDIFRFKYDFEIFKQIQTRQFHNWFFLPKGVFCCCYSLIYCLISRNVNECKRENCFRSVLGEDELRNLQLSWVPHSGWEGTGRSKEFLSKTSFSQLNIFLMTLMILLESTAVSIFVDILVVLTNTVFAFVNSTTIYNVYKYWDGSAF